VWGQQGGVWGQQAGMGGNNDARGVTRRSMGAAMTAWMEQGVNRRDVKARRRPVMGA